MNESTHLRVWLGFWLQRRREGFVIVSELGVVERLELVVLRRRGTRVRAERISASVACSSRSVISSVAFPGGRTFSPAWYASSRV